MSLLGDTLACQPQAATTDARFAALSQEEIMQFAQNSVPVNTRKGDRSAHYKIFKLWRAQRGMCVTFLRIQIKGRNLQCSSNISN